MHKNILGKNIQRRREELGWSRMRLAERSGVQIATVRMIETGETRKPGVYTIYDLAVALNTTIRDLLEEDPDWRNRKRSV